MDAVSDIKARLNIEDVVSEYVELKRAGRNFKGLSPFTNERTPSFIVSPEKQIWHDFSSGRGGDMFSFIMEVEGVDFRGAMELLARKSGVDLEAYQTTQKKSSGTLDKKRLYSAVSSAVQFYQIQLTKHHGALKYLREVRNYEKQTLLDFRIGYSPSSGTELTKHLVQRGFSEKELVKVGLTVNRSGRYVDMFRGRIMVPLQDAEGRPVGFTARLLNNDLNAPKYINTPATILYDKSRQAFGFFMAKEAMRKSGFVVVVEGNLDVVASHQAGLKQVVASAGTALTIHHLKLLKRFTSDIRLAFDDDRAGQDAAIRAIPLAQSADVTLSIISIPAGKDPDELIKKDPKLWLSAVEDKQYMVDWLFDKLSHTHDLASAVGKRAYSDELLNIIRELKDEVEREHYLKKLAQKTDTSYETIKKKFSQNNAHQPKRKKAIKPSKAQDDADEREQRVKEQHLLAIATKVKSVAEKLGTVPLDVFSEQAKETAIFIQENPGVSPFDSEYGKMLLLLYEEQYQHTDEVELEYQSRHLLSRLVTTYAKKKKQTILQTIENVSDTDQQTLLKAIKQLDDLVLQFQKSLK